MYLGNSFMLVGAPLMVGSIYGLIIGISGIFHMAGRIIGEERMLVNNPRCRLEVPGSVQLETIVY